MIFDIIKHAKQLLFNNSKSGLSATNVQDAIDELDALIGLGGFKTVIGVSDCNDIAIGYSAYCSSNTTNAPNSEGTWQIFCYGVNSDNRIQIGFNFNNLAVRRRNGGTWSEWKMYLSTSGGTVTGDLKAKAIYPTANNTGIIGAGTLAWGSVNANCFDMRKNVSRYGAMAIGSEGTETNGGYAFLNVGNNIPIGTNGNAWGYINLFGQKKGATSIRPTNNTDDNVTISLPKTSGTLMLKENFYVDDEGYVVIDFDI